MVFLLTFGVRVIVVILTADSSRSSISTHGITAALAIMFVIQLIMIMIELKL
jgi:hypothetical protein